MKNYKAFIRQATQAVSVLRDMAELSVYDMAADDVALKTARKYAKLADVFFGPTDSPRIQREAVALAEERGLSMERLQMIDSHAQKLKKSGVPPGSCVRNSLRTRGLTRKSTP